MSHTGTPNRLHGESSLYLRQHAFNPVDWYPWGEEALARARDEDKPVFLSVGYSACHWCHVMERESFEDGSTANILNEHFVCIKVDREERPDLDTVYMSALQVMNRGGGGWPLSVFLTPALKPFFAGTYYPPDERYAHQGMPSFKRLLARIIEAWRTQRGDIDEQAEQVTHYLKEVSQIGGGTGPLSPHILEGARHALQRSYDPQHGGFGTAPKFPHAIEMRLLLRLARRLDAPAALDMAKHTLDMMARGGMYDQLGGGFHRYSVDAHWLVPHFEKMLYDNALLASAYTEAFQVTGEPLFRTVVTETLDYVLREMTAECGAFFSTQDADSEGEEGKFFVWARGEIESLLTAEEAAEVIRVYGVADDGNFEGKSILFRKPGDAPNWGVLNPARAKLLAARSRRIWPGRDEKILTSWNGLTVAAFAQAGAALGEPRYVDAAAKAARWLSDTVISPDGRLTHSATAAGGAKLNGYLDDYAFLIDGLVTLSEAAGDASWLGPAAALAGRMVEQFADRERGGFFYTAADHEALIARTKDSHDGSTPSGNSMAATALLRLAALTGREDFRAAGVGTLTAFADAMDQSPMALSQMLIALDFHLGPAEEIVVVGGGDAAETEKVLRKLRAAFRPNAVLVAHGAAAEPPAEVAELLQGRTAVGGRVTTYVCRNRVCDEPIVGAGASG